ncbi:MAG: ATP-binding protein [Deltaproteobacteria bacterium]|nr:ATP-binding protein [Deltaproteobacteria bacterium]MBW2318658.1 ATP-binding protein [Deltaproteobacteria bacterium]
MSGKPPKKISKSSIQLLAISNRLSLQINPFADAEPTLLTQIFEELIENAIKFNNSECKRVEIGWKPKGGNHCELFIRDNGIGIEPRHYEQVFNIFHRLHSRLDYTGTGIGLAIVKKATFKLHGSVRVESKPSEGSTFFVRLPKTQTKE